MFHVYLAGRVHRVGALEVEPTDALRVSQAIAMAGGLGAHANAHLVKLLHRRLDGTSEMTTVDLKKIDEGGGLDPVVQAGDINQRSGTTD